LLGIDYRHPHTTTTTTVIPSRYASYAIAQPPK
jgi:hypothetical protein